jgi:exodeoxyribonuclease VII small subunit
MTKKMTFEQSMERLEQIVQAMEQGNVPLEESMALFQEGTALAAQCEKLLDNARQQIEKVTCNADGEPVMEEFIDEQDV